MDEKEKGGGVGVGGRSFVSDSEKEGETYISYTQVRMWKGDGLVVWLVELVNVYEIQRYISSYYYDYYDDYYYCAGKCLRRTRG